MYKSICSIQSFLCIAFFCVLLSSLYFIVSGFQSFTYIHKHGFLTSNDNSSGVVLATLLAILSVSLSGKFVCIESGWLYFIYINLGYYNNDHIHTHCFGFLCTHMKKLESLAEVWVFKVPYMHIMRKIPLFKWD